MHQRAPIQKIVFSALVAGLYLALTAPFAATSYGPIQMRLAEALCVLPFYMPFTSWGLFVGCLLSNLLGGNGMLDIVFGSLATLIAGYCTSKMPRRWLAPLPAVLINALVIGYVLSFVYAPDALWATFPVFALEVGAGQFIVCYGLGLPLLRYLPRLPFFARLPGLAPNARKTSY